MKILKSVLGKLFFEINAYLDNKSSKDKKSETKILVIFREMPLAIKDFRTQGMPSGEVSISNQYLSKMLDSFEELKHIDQYRRPLTLGTYSELFILPVLVSLDNIQEHLENPFDQVGENDVTINSEKFISRLEF